MASTAIRRVPARTSFTMSFACGHTGTTRRTVPKYLRSAKTPLSTAWTDYQAWRAETIAASAEAPEIECRDCVITRTLPATTLTDDRIREFLARLYGAQVPSLDSLSPGMRDLALRARTGWVQQRWSYLTSMVCDAIRVLDPVLPQVRNQRAVTVDPPACLWHTPWRPAQVSDQAMTAVALLLHDILRRDLWLGLTATDSYAWRSLLFGAQRPGEHTSSFVSTSRPLQAVLFSRLPFTTWDDMYQQWLLAQRCFRDDTTDGYDLTTVLVTCCNADATGDNWRDVWDSAVTINAALSPAPEPDQVIPLIAV